MSKNLEQIEKGFLVESHDGGNLQELLLLIQSYYAEGDILNESYLKWQYHGNPFGGPIMQIARHVETGEVVGQYLVIPVNYTLRGNPIKGSLSLNTLTRPDFQGKGLFTTLATSTYKQCLDIGIGLTIGFPNPNSLPGFLKKLNFKNTGSFTFLIRPLNFLGIAKDVFGNGMKSQRHGDDLEVARFEPIKFDNNVIVKEFDSGDYDSYTRFWTKASFGYSFTTHRTLDYLRWRYENIPTRKYKIIVISKDLEIQGLFVFRVKIMYGFKTVILVDVVMLHEPTARSNVSEGIKSVISFYKKQSINLAITLLNDKSFEFDILKSCGFKRIPQRMLPQKFPFIVRSHDSSQVPEFGETYLTFGDYDVL